MASPEGGDHMMSTTKNVDRADDSRFGTRASGRKMSDDGYDRGP